MPRPSSACPRTISRCLAYYVAPLPPACPTVTTGVETYSCSCEGVAAGARPRHTPPSGPVWTRWCGKGRLDLSVRTPHKESRSGPIKEEDRLCLVSVRLRMPLKGKKHQSSGQHGLTVSVFLPSILIDVFLIPHQFRAHTVLTPPESAVVAWRPAISERHLISARSSTAMLRINTQVKREAA